MQTDLYIHSLWPLTASCHTHTHVYICYVYTYECVHTATSTAHLFSEGHCVSSPIHTD